MEPVAQNPMRWRQLKKCNIITKTDVWA